MRRNLILDENDLIMVVKEDVVKQIDENRGELNRTEFVNYLIQCQLKEYNSQKNYVTKEEFQQFTQGITELFHDFLQFFVSYGMALGKRYPEKDFQSIVKQLESLDKPDGEKKEP
ncbi:MAG: hypothetical protein A2144_05975 [Chloroflexi bacterium RBG_16_50_9]|nr:MAG: hypothetical protein A2144_05975 [Chloroflexi bacterium RBG_16_50_9]